VKAENEAARLGPLTFGAGAYCRLAQTQLPGQIVAVADCIAYNTLV